MNGVNDNIIHQALLAARLHDPIEKALILMRTAEGHESGTSRKLIDKLFPQGVSAAVNAAVKRADRWAAAADRTAFPKRDGDGAHPAWQSVRFSNEPVLIHPLTGESFDLEKLEEVEPSAIKALALNHLSSLIHEGDLRKTALAFWRFGPDIEATMATAEGLEGKDIRNLWMLLPADTRVPDHTIHDHLDLAAAFAAGFAADLDSGPALLAVSLGPVQEFITAARSTSDLWAGSHLLSRISWEAMKVVCEAIGPEAILFPRLRGVPQVDVWLRDKCGLRDELFAHERWTQTSTDANPLFTAALPNRFTALVPGSMARELAEKIIVQVRDWVKKKANESFKKLLDEAVEHDVPELPGYAQIAAQLEGFPEVHWASVSWSLVGTDTDGKVAVDDSRLVAAMQPFFADSPPGYLGTQAWRLLSGGLKLEQGWFYKPNPGALYPALHELLERALSATKSVRPFAQTKQEGWRDSLTGEVEWLTTDRAQLMLPPGGRVNTLWAKVAGRFGIKKGEHLGALGTLKRMWPSLYAEELKGILGADAVNRFVVSTHAMAVTGAILTWLRSGSAELPKDFRHKVDESKADRVALPRKLVKKVHGRPEENTLRKLAGWLDVAAESDNGETAANARREASGALGLRQNMEAYYGLLLMDGDSMGAWLSADRRFTQPVEASFHPQIRNASNNKFGDDPNFEKYANQPNAATPSRHMVISDALNQFSLRLVPAIVEESFAGRVLYAGGDDVMAMLPVAEILPAMGTLRAAYSGVNPKNVGLDDECANIQPQANGFVLDANRVLRLMGDKATASCGAVIAHHQAPLSAVLRELRAAEQHAKQDGRRDAFSLAVIKRSGGALVVTAKWGEPLRVLLDLIAVLRDPEVSRRAVYHSVDWMKDLPDDNPGLMRAVIVHQFKRKGADKQAEELAQALVAIATDVNLRPDGISTRQWLSRFMQVAEFFAREARTGATEARDNQQQEEAA